MKILLLTQGSRGDFQPFVALASALAEAGHEVVLGAPSAAVPLAHSLGVRIEEFDDVTKKLMSNSELRRSLIANGRRLRYLKAGVKAIRNNSHPMIGILNRISEIAEGDFDIVVHNPLLPGHQIAERLGIPSVLVAMQPFWVPTSSFPHPLFRLPLPRSFNRVSYFWNRLSTLPTRFVTRVLAGDIIAEWRKENLGLAPRRDHHDFLRHQDGSRTTVIHAFSKHILPTPLDYPDWVHTTGYWYLRDQPDWRPPDGLSNFLAEDEPPVYIGFGSMVNLDPQATGRIISDAIRLADVRAVVAGGWGGIPRDVVGKGVFWLDEVPHEWLFPRVSAVVHHGGTGTMGAALAAGRPQVVFPFIADQPFNAERLCRSGVAPAPLPQRELAPESLAEAIRRVVTDREMSSRADELAHDIRGENGLDAAVEIIEEACTS